MRSTLSVAFATGLATLAASYSGLAVDPPEFERIAPKGSALVASAKDLNAFVHRIDASPMGQFFVAPELESVAGPAREEFKRDSAKRLQELGVDIKTVPWPGPIGFALFVEHNEELDAPELGVLAWADYQERAEDAGKLFDGVIRELEKEHGKPFEQVEITGGKKATRLELPADEPPAGPQQPQPPRRGRPRGVDALGELTAIPEAFYYFRNESQFFIASSVPVLEEALASAAGEATLSIADSEEWRGIAGLAGEQDLSIVIIPAPLEPLAEPFLMGPMASAKVIISKLFGGIRAFAIFGSARDGEAMLDIGTAIYAPGERGGVLEIISEATPIEPPPSLVGECAISFQRMNVRFGMILEMIEGIIEALPDNEADGIRGMMEPFNDGLKQGLSSLGPAVFLVTEASPGGAEDARTLTAMKCSNEKVANALLATILPLAGMMPRDFRGQVVYSGEGSPVEFGLGGGALLIGTPESVEQALRSASDPSAKSLADDPMYRRCSESVAAGPVCSWGYYDLATAFDAQRKAMIKAQSAEVVVETDEDADDDTLDVMVPIQFDATLEKALEKIDYELLVRHFGPVVWDVRDDPRGLVMRGKWLRPEAAK